MYRIIYLSSSVKYLNGEEIDSILSKSREKNIKNGITGFLIHTDGDFIQVIEGPKTPILELFESIKKDTRHFGILTVFNAEIENKFSPEWSMGFCITNYKELQRIEVYENLKKRDATTTNDSLIISFLTSFIEFNKSKFVFV